MSETMSSQPSYPSAKLLITPVCPHCPAVLEGLSRLLKEGVLGRLEVVNLASHPEVMEETGARSVPWLQIGPFVFEGRMELAELREWVATAASPGGWGQYYRYLLGQQRLERVVELVRERPATLDDLAALLSSLETPMGVRIGVGAVLEELTGEPLLIYAVPALEALLDAEEPQIRADACHYLGLTGATQVVPALRRMADDPSHEVREIAAESLALLEAPRT